MSTSKGCDARERADISEVLRTVPSTQSAEVNVQPSYLVVETTDK